MVKIYCLILLAFITRSAMAQDSLKKVKILPVPTIGYSPETSTYVGAVSLLTFDFYSDHQTRISNAKLEFSYTWNKQLIFDSGWNYFFKEEKWFTKGKFSYSDYPDYYYGIGSNTPEQNKLLFYSKRIIFDAAILKKAGKNFFIGPTARFINYFDLSFNSMLAVPELKNNSTTGAGLTFLSDSRNNILTPERGFYFNFTSTYNFSKENYLKSELDLRFYRSWKDKLTWSNRLYGQVNSGNPPFYDKAFLGGDQFVRGYNYGRYRDNNIALLQSELRFKLFWRIGMSAFGGYSNLTDEKILANNLKYNYGTGLRFLVDKKDKTNLRLDYAIGEGSNSAFYISFGESF